MARIFCSTSRFCDTTCEVRRWCRHHRSYCSETYKSDLLKSTPDKYICLFLVLFAIQTLKSRLGYTYRQFSKSGQTWNEHSLRRGSEKRMFGDSLFRPSRQSNIPTSGEERFKYPLPRENKTSQMPYPRTNKDNQIPTPCPPSHPPPPHRLYIDRCITTKKNRLWQPSELLPHSVWQEIWNFQEIRAKKKQNKTKTIKQSLFENRRMLFFFESIQNIISDLKAICFEIFARKLFVSLNFGHYFEWIAFSLSYWDSNRPKSNVWNSS